MKIEDNHINSSISNVLMYVKKNFSFKANTNTKND